MLTVHQKLSMGKGRKSWTKCQFEYICIYIYRLYVHKFQINWKEVLYALNGERYVWFHVA